MEHQITHWRGFLAWSFSQSIQPTREVVAGRRLIGILRDGVEGREDRVALDEGIGLGRRAPHDALDDGLLVRDLVEHAQPPQLELAHRDVGQGKRPFRVSHLLIEGRDIDRRGGEGPGQVLEEHQRYQPNCD